MRSLRHELHRARLALAGFLRGFLGLAGTPGESPLDPSSASPLDPSSASPLDPSADAEAARRALEERAARRRSCC
jgi:hypothetical protein